MERRARGISLFYVLTLLRRVLTMNMHGSEAMYDAANSHFFVLKIRSLLSEHWQGRVQMESRGLVSVDPSS